MKKYIFLDIDGVISSLKSIENCFGGLTKECQDNLGEILSLTKAKIILTSSWRLNTIEETQEFMKNKGFLFCEEIVGVTIRAYKYINKESKIHLSIPRGVEIKQWIDTHIHSNNGKDCHYKKIGRDFNYVILDDDSDMLLEQKDYFIQCDSNEGLTKKECLIAVTILNKI